MEKEEESPLQKLVMDRLFQLKVGPIEAATRKGLERTFIRDIVAGRKRSIRGDKLAQLADALELDPGMLAIGVAVPVHDAGPTSKVSPPRAEPRRVAGGDVPVRGTAAGSLIDRFRLEDRVVERVARPPGLARAEGVYAIFVGGPSMDPAHPHGALRFVNPNRPYSPGDSVIVQARWSEEQPAEAYIGFFVGEDDEEVTIRKLKPASSVAFKRGFVEFVHKVPSMNELFGV